MRLVVFLLAAALYGQTEPDPAEVLKAAQAKVLEAMKRLPKYACIETIERLYYAPVKPKHITTPCEETAGEKPMRLTATDRLRLDVAQGEEYEIYSWPGASHFDLTEIDRIVDRGPFGSGSFGGYLLDIFDNEATRFEHRGENVRNGKKMLVYAYTVPRNASHYAILGYHSWLTTGFSGMVEVETESLEIARVTMITPQLPAETKLCMAESTLDYARFQIGDGTFLLPRRSELRLSDRNGEQTNNTTVYSGCREYQAHSSIRFGDTPPTAAPMTPSDGTKAQLPGGLPRRYSVDLRMKDAVDSEKSAAGDPVSATVAHDVHPYQSKEIVIPAGAVAHGRVSRVEHHFVPYDYVVIGIVFQSIEIGGRTLPFEARPNRAGMIIRVNSALPSPGPTPQVRTPIGPPDSLVFPFVKRHVLAAGTVSQWLTEFPPIGAK